MRRPEFSLSGLMLFVALCGLALGLVATFHSAVDDSQPIVSLQSSADGRVLAVGLWDGTGRFINGRTGKLLGLLDQQENTFHGKLSPDGRLFAYASWRGKFLGPTIQTLVIHDIAANRELSRTQVQFAEETLAFLPNGHEVAFATGTEDEIVVWDVLNCKERRRLANPDPTRSRLVRLVVSPDSNTLALISRGRGLTIELCPMESGSRRSTLLTGASNAAVAFSGNGRRLVAFHPTPSSDATTPDVSVVDVATLQPIRRLGPTNLRWARLALSHDGAKLAIAEQGLQFWDVNLGRSFDPLDGESPQDLADAPDANLWFTATEGGIARWNAETFEREGTITNTPVVTRIALMAAAIVVLVVVWLLRRGRKNPPRPAAGEPTTPLVSDFRIL